MYKLNYSASTLRKISVNLIEAIPAWQGLWKFSATAPHNYSPSQVFERHKQSIHHSKAFSLIHQHYYIMVLWKHPLTSTLRWKNL